MIKKLNWEGMNNTFQFDEMFIGGQINFSVKNHLVEEGVTCVINARNFGENDVDADRLWVEELGLSYHHLPVVDGSGFIKENVDAVYKIISKHPKTLFHCASGNRIAGWSILYQVEQKGKSQEEAIENAFKSGLTNPVFIQMAQSYLNPK